jgi:hypothetical protein
MGKCSVPEINGPIISLINQRSEFFNTIGQQWLFCYLRHRIIASIEDPAVIQRILAHLDDNASSAATALLPDCRASPSPLMDLLV